MPKINKIPGPNLTKRQQEAVREAEIEIAKSPNDFNGDIVWVNSVSYSGIDVFLAQYSWIFSKGKMPGVGYLDGAVIFKKNGLFLFQKRSARVQKAGFWDLSVTGTLETSNVEQEMVREGKEEMGIDLSNRLRPEVLAICSGVKVSILFSVDLEIDEVLKPDPNEVSKVAFLSHAPDHFIPFSKDIFQFYLREISQ